MATVPRGPGLAALDSVTRGAYRLHAMWNDEEAGVLREGSMLVSIGGADQAPVVLQLN